MSSIGQMEDAASFMVLHDLHPSRLANGEYALADGAKAYEAFAAGAPGKISINPAA